MVRGPWSVSLYVVCGGGGGAGGAGGAGGGGFALGARLKSNCFCGSGAELRRQGAAAIAAGVDFIVEPVSMGYGSGTSVTKLSVGGRTTRGLGLRLRFFVGGGTSCGGGTSRGGGKTLGGGGGGGGGFRNGAGAST